MIDEELYQQAADELNSDRRRPHIWARACALASDDHDEARYLYTNLRVEELLEARSKGPQDTIVDTSPDVDATLALEPMDETLAEDDVKGFLDDFDANSQLDPGLSEDDIPSSVSAPSGIDRPDSSDDLLQLEPDADEAAKTSLGRLPDVHLDDPDADLMVDYVPEQNPLLDDTHMDVDIAEAEFEKELEDFKSEQTEDDALPEANAFTSDELQKNHRQGTDTEPTHELGAEQATIDEPVDADQTGPWPVDLAVLDVDGDGAAADVNSETAEFSSILAEDLTQANMDVLDAHTNELDEMLENTGYQPVQPAEQDGDLKWLDEDEPVSSNASDVKRSEREPVVYEDDPLTEELNRQADELDFGHNADETADHSLQIAEALSADDRSSPLVQDDASIHADALSELDNEQFLDNDTSADTERPEQQADVEDLPVAASVAANGALTAAAPDLSSPDGTDKTAETTFPLDLTLGRKGTLYSVYRCESRAQAVKSGVSWPALFLTLPYLLYRQLFGTALAYAVLWVVAIGGLVISGLAWLDAGAAVTPLTQACTIGFALLGIFGLVYLPFRYGNVWRAEKLEDRGFELVAQTRARNPGRAIARARRHAALDA